MSKAGRAISVVAPRFAGLERRWCAQVGLPAYLREFNSAR